MDIETRRAARLRDYYRHQDARQATHRAYMQARAPAISEAKRFARAQAAAAALDADAINRLSGFDLAYLAGLIDGEGCIGVHQHSGRLYTLTLTVSMTHRGVIDWLAAILHTASVKAAIRPDTRHKPIFTVRMTGARVGLLCRRLLPFLRVKREQAVLAVAFATHLDKGRRLDEQDASYRRGAYERMKALNAKGVHLSNAPTDRQLPQV